MICNMYIKGYIFVCVRVENLTFDILLHIDLHAKYEQKVKDD